MARFKGKFIVGSIGPVTYRRSKNGGVISKRAKDVKQTEATKKSARFFGGVASFAKVLRLQLGNICQQDTTLMTRLNKELLAVMLNCYTKETKTYNFDNDYFSRLDGLELNADSPLREYLWTEPVVDLSENKLAIHIPELIGGVQVKFPISASHCQVQIQVMQFDLRGGHYQKSPLIGFTLEQDGVVIPAQDFLVDVVPGVLCVVGLGLRFFKAEYGMHVLLNSIELSPAALLFAKFNQGVFSEQVSKQTKTVHEDGSSEGRINIFWPHAHAGFKN